MFCRFCMGLERIVVGLFMVLHMALMGRYSVSVAVVLDDVL